MTGIVIGLSLLAASILQAAYAEFKDGNRRDSGLLAGLGGSGALASAGLYLA